MVLDEVRTHVVDSESSATLRECEQRVKNNYETFLQPQLEECIIRLKDEDRYEDKSGLISMVETFRPRLHDSVALILSRCKESIDSGESDE
jgi:hypothetical protein